MSPEQLARLGQAFDGRVCVSAWLGHGNVLFLRFGSKANRHELSTNCADWQLEGSLDVLASDTATSSSRDELVTATEALVGATVVRWNLVTTVLRLELSNGATLTVSPWPAQGDVGDAWAVSAPDGQVLATSTDGRTVVVAADLPVAQWFGARR